MSEHGLMLITVGNREEATSIARHLVDERLVAGVQMLPIESVYTWDGEIVEDHEILLIAKTRKDRFSAIKAVVTELHSYDVPPVVMIDIDKANRPYLTWIDGAVE